MPVAAGVYEVRSRRNPRLSEGKRGRATGRGASPPGPSLAGEARGEQVGDAVGPADGLGGHPGVGPPHEGGSLGAAEKLAEAAVGYRGAKGHVAPPEPPCGLPKMLRRLAPAAPLRGQGGPDHQGLGVRPGQPLPL